MDQALAEAPSALELGPAWRPGFAQLGSAFFTELQPTPLPSPHLVSFNRELAAELGLSPAVLAGEPAVAAFSGLIAINYGWASFTVERDLDVGAALAALPAEIFPLTVATAADWGRYGSDEDYEFALGAFLGGLAK